jgi:hypothetical protein
MMHLEAPIKTGHKKFRGNSSKLDANFNLQKFMSKLLPTPPPPPHDAHEILD